MNRKLIYTFSLIGFFLMWGALGFLAAAPRTEPVMQATVPPEANSQIVPDAAQVNGGIPVTGEAQSVTGIFLVYVWFALGALILIMALLNAANKQTVPFAHPKEPPEQS